MSLKLADERSRQRFEAKFTRATKGCWEWIAAIDPSGYGRFSVKLGPTRKDYRMKLAHRVSYETYSGPIPAGLDLDHLCRNRRCVNPDHLEPVTRSENLRRSPLMGNASLSKTHCPRGHEYSAENTRVTKSDSRSCRSCERARNREKARAGIYNPPVPCQSCGKVLRKGNLPKHYRAFHPEIAVALGIKTKETNE